MKEIITNPISFIGAAVVGLVSAAGVYLIEQFRQDKRRHTFNQDLARLDGQLSTLREELELLRQLQRDRANNSVKSKPHRRKLRTSSALSTAVNSTEEYNSAVDVDSSDLEFYDLSSEEDVTSGEGAQHLQKEIDIIDKLLEDETEYEEALQKLDSLIGRHPRNAELLWRQGKALKIKINQTSDFEERKELINRGISICQYSTELDPESAFCHKWFAILIGLRGEFQPTKERIMDGHLFSQHINKALRLTPDDPALHHLLGRFTFEVAKLSWLEKTVAATLFAELPSCTYQDALEQFMEAERLSRREWKENRLFIAKCELAIGKTESAVEWLDKAECASNDEEDKVHEEVRSLLQKYKKQ